MQWVISFTLTVKVQKILKIFELYLNQASINCMLSNTYSLYSWLS